MDLPNDPYWNDPTGHHPWYPSHGSPTVAPNSIWMWSYNSYGEGVNLAYNFISGKRYCMETGLTFTKQAGVIVAGSNANIILTPT